MAAYSLPADVLRLADQRRPFVDLPDRVLRQVVAQTLDTPERRGRYTNAVREIVGCRPVVAPAHTVVESHIDITVLDRDLMLGLISLGYEPDNFAKMNPPQYRFHFSLHYVCNTFGRTRQLFDDVRWRAAEAAALLQASPTANGYVETEVYRSQYAFTAPAGPLVTGREDGFPFTEQTFTAAVAPMREAAATGGASRDTRRAADIHVKIPGRFPPWTGRRPAAPGDYNSAPGLARKLESAGFYEIISDAGNFLYSAHFARLDDANAAYHALCGFAAQAGGIVGVAREICTGLWRTRRQSAGGTTLADVPPLLRFGSTPLDGGASAARQHNPTDASQTLRR